ncbi:MAG: hypothetical protein MSQ68_00970 [Trueperella pyogenes]|nr:hypothetical protein [Trueperella pyogenes]MCI7688934.1 hypothetical protein [Trueperella pyogenes]
MDSTHDFLAQTAQSVLAVVADDLRQAEEADPHLVKAVANLAGLIEEVVEKVTGAAAAEAEANGFYTF